MLKSKKTVLLSIALFGLMANASADLIKATITADNHYALYTGNSDGSGLTLIGQNELGAGGSTTGYNWSIPETYTFNLAANQQIYIAAWSDNAVAQGLIGEIVTTTTNSTTYTNVDDWIWKPTYQDLGDGSAAPVAATVSSFIASGSWQAINYSKNNGDSPWGTISKISSNADWIWGVPMEPGSGAGEFHIYTMKTTNVPEPASVQLLLLGLAGSIGYASVLRRKNR